MKKIILSAGFCAVLLFSAVIPTKADSLELCSSIGESAEKIMEARQLGISMEILMNKLPEEGPTRNLMQNVLIMAYDSPRYSTEKYRSESIKDFRNLWYLECIKTMSE